MPELDQNCASLIFFIQIHLSVPRGEQLCGSRCRETRCDLPAWRGRGEALEFTPPFFFLVDLHPGNSPADFLSRRQSHLSLIRLQRQTTYRCSDVTVQFESSVFSGPQFESKTVNQQSFHQQLLHNRIESAAAGYNVALLLCGALTEQISTLVDRSVIRQVALTHCRCPGAIR